MLLLQPISKRRIWGTNRLHQFSGDPVVEKIGSVYTVSAIPEINTKIMNGEFSGQGLYDVVKENPALFGLEDGEEYPIIVSITGADEDLSIQVHPTDDYAKEHEDAPYGKSESWYFIEPPEKGWIYAGAKIKEKTVIEEKIKNQKFEEVVNTLPIQQFDYVFIPSGTLHALTKGSIVYEIQQSTDLTYRFYDYDRVDADGNKRELNLEKALDTLVSTQVPNKSAFPKDEWKVELPYELLRTNVKGYYKNEREIAQALTVIGGTLVIENETVQKGSSAVLLPGEEVMIQQEVEVVIATPKRYWKK